MAVSGTATVVKTEEDKTPSVLTPAPIVLDMGKQGRGKIKKLRKGRGKLLNDIQTAIGHLQSSGEVEATAQPIIIVLRERPKKAKKALGGLF